MFCSNCGKEASGNFCYNCGARLVNVNNSSEDINNEAEAISSDEYVKINSVEVNLKEIVNANGNNKIAAIKHLRTITGIGLSEAKKVIDEAYDKFYKQEPKKGFWQTIKEQGQAQMRQEMEKKQARKDRIAKLEEEGVAYCPKCLSTSLTAHKKGFGIGKAVIGASFMPLGLVAGNIGAKKIRVTCLKCGHQFWAGKQ